MKENDKPILKNISQQVRTHLSYTKYNYEIGQRCEVVFKQDDEKNWCRANI